MSLSVRRVRLQIRNKCSTSGGRAGIAGFGATPPKGLNMASVLRRILVCFFIYGLAMSIGDLFQYRMSSLTWDLDGVGDVQRLTSVEGLEVHGDARPGDKLKATLPTAASRLGTLPYPSRAEFTDLRTGHRVELSDTKLAPSHPIFAITADLVRILIECGSLVLLVAKGAKRGVVALSVFLFGTVYFIASVSGMVLGDAGIIIYELPRQALQIAEFAALIYLAATFAPKTAATRRIATIGYVLASLSGLALLGFNATVVMTGIAIDLTRADRYVEAVLLCFAFALFVLGAVASRGSERRRIAVLGISTLIGSSIGLYSLFGGSVTYDAFEAYILLASLLVMAVGLVYGIVVEQLFDIAFVVNRAVVYAVTSAFVVLSFVAIESIVGWAASSFGHVQSAALQLALAIVVALSLRPIHSRADAFVDNAIFAARHRAANALRRFADDCGEFRTSDALLTATLDTLSTFARVSACAIYLADEQGDLHSAGSEGILSADWSGDDVAVVRMRTSRAPIARASFPQLANADIAFPMLRRRSLIGAIACLLPPRAEPYSPEEHEALSHLAREVGASLVALEAIAAQRLAAENADLRLRLGIQIPDLRPAAERIR